MGHTRSLFLLAAGGHAKVLLSLVRAAGYRVLGVSDPKLIELGQSHWRDVPVLDEEAMLASVDPDQVGLINGVGQVVGGTARQRLYERMRQRGFRFPPLVHPSASVDESAQLAEGVQVMAGAVVQADCRIGENSIVNTRASADHDCCIGAHVHLAPAATLCGAVRVLDNAFVASGATVLQGLTIGRHALVGAGATLTRDLADSAVVLPPRIVLRTQAPETGPADAHGEMQ